LCLQLLLPIVSSGQRNARESEAQGNQQEIDAQLCTHEEENEEHEEDSKP
jgi:hypothetical protein